MVCKNCNSELRPGAMFCPQCGQRQSPEKPKATAGSSGNGMGITCPDCRSFMPFGQEQCSCGWTWEKGKKSGSTHKSVTTSSSFPEMPTTPASAYTSTHYTTEYSSSAQIPINTAALVVVLACALLWLVAPFIELFGEGISALEIVSEDAFGNVVSQSATIMGIGILISLICILCRNNGARIAGGLTAGVVLTIPATSDVLKYADDLGDYIDYLFDLWAWGWLLMFAGLITLAFIGGRQE